MNEVFCKLRKYNWKNYKLYIICNFIAMMLITAYSTLMFSDTVLSVFPKGGDSRKQAFGIFTLVCIGCVMFTIYAAALFYRMKTKEMGILLALGASKKQIQKTLFKEVTALNLLSSIAGIIMGVPFTWILWQAFRLLLIDTEEMNLIFEKTFILIPLCLLVFILFVSYITALPYLHKMNVIDVIYTEHKNEMVHDVNKKYGVIGGVFALCGCVISYMLPGWYMDIFSAYPPDWLNLSYILVFIGIYMMLLNSVVNGISIGRKNRYVGMVARGMMKFQGKQTVNSMLVITLLIGGACFGSFYVPTMMASSNHSIDNREYDYVYRYRSDMTMFNEQDIINIGKPYGVKINTYQNTQVNIFGMDGERQVEEGKKFHYEYEKLYGEARVISASDFEKLTGKPVTIKQGEYYGITNEEEEGTYWLNKESEIFTNMVTREELHVKWGGYLYFNELSGEVAYYVLGDEDMKKLSRGNENEWKEKLVCMTVENDQYPFANELYHEFVSRFPKDCEIGSYYDKVAKIGALNRGETYWGDESGELPQISLQDMDKPEFKREWLYTPSIKVIDQVDYVKNYAVFLMMFIFIVIVCLVAALIIAYTRCITIAINNRYVFEDLKRLGASNHYLKKEIRRQSFKVFTLPSIIGMSIMYLFFVLILTMNDGYARLSTTEIIALIYCFFALILIGFIIYLVYQLTLKRMRIMLLNN